MKNNYLKLKLSILFQTVFVTALTLLVGYILMEFVLDDASNEVVQMLKAINVEEEAAIAWYWRVIGNNKEFFLIIGFLLLFSLFFFVALSRMTRYLRQIEKGINNIASDSEESIQLISELGPIETRLADIKQTLKKQQRETAEAEKKKKQILLRIAPTLWDDIAQWAEEDFRSING